MDEAGLTPPLFESDRANDQFVARYFFHHFLGAEDVAWLARFKDAHLSDEEARALVVVREAGAIDNATYRDLNKVDTLAASQSLRRLRDAGLLTQKGRGSATYYVPTDRLAADQEGLSSNPSAPYLVTLPSLSSNPPGLPSNPDSLYSNLNEADDARRALLNELTGELAARVGAIGQRHPPEEVRQVVVDLCRLRAWRVEELASLLRRNAETVRQNYLRPLMREGKLVMTKPNEPNDPEQAYLATRGKQ